MLSLPELLIAHRFCVQNKIKKCVYSSGQEEGLAFVHEFSQNHGGEGSSITRAGGAYPLCHKGLLEGAAVPFFDLLGS